MNEKGSIGIKILVIILVILIIAAAILLAIKIKNSKTILTDNNIEAKQDENKIEEQKEPEKQVQIYSGTDRPIAVMIDNVGDALPQAGLNDAYIVYEIIAEGGLTRYMAVFKGVNLDKIGPVRSSRHYYLDYAMENDAIYVHYGWSPQAQSDISKYKINNINGITAPSTTFWRVKDKASPHDAVTSTEKILNQAQKYGYRTTSDSKSILNYVTDEVNLETEDSIIATDVVIPYPSEKARFKYNEETSRYERYTNGTLQKDWTTSEVISTKNIIITFASNSTLSDGENKGRQNLDNIGDLKGYYITNGKAIEIVCSKTARNTKTVYKDLEGNIINVNDGNTFIEICPINTQVTFE